MKRLLVVILLLSTHGSWADQIEVIQLHSRTVDEIIPLVSPLMRPGEAISGTGYKLILRASEQTRKEVKKILASLDRGLTNLLITVRQGDATTLDRSKASARIRYNSELGGAVSGSAAHQQSTDQWRGGQRVRVLEGTPAYIHTGIAFAAPDIIQPYGGQISYGRRDIGTGVYVLPRLNGDRVSLEISPYREALTGKGYTADVRNVTTFVSGRVGEWIFIGGSVQDGAASGRGIASGSNASATQRYGVQVRVDVLE